MPISNWDFRGSSWLQPSEHGFRMVAADINDIKQKTIDRLKALHPEVWQERPKMQQHHLRDENDEYMYDDEGDAVYEWRPEEREDYDYDQERYVYVPTGRMEPHPVGREFDFIVDRLPPEAHKLYEWILRELKKDRMPAGETFTDVRMPVEISEEFTKTIPTIPDEPEEEEDELAEADGGGRNHAVDPIEQYRIRENEYGERFVNIELSRLMIIRQLEKFWSHLVWLDEYNRPMPQYRSKQFTFPVMLRWNQLFQFYLDVTKTSHYEKPNNIFTCSNRWTITERTTEHDLALEGEIMGHCVGQYARVVADNECRIFSLADKKGFPHVTIETRADRDGDGTFDPNFAGLNWPGFARQIYGKSNQEPIPAYAALVKEWIDSIDHHVNWVGMQVERQPEILVDTLGTLHAAATRIRSGEEMPLTNQITETGPDRYGLYRASRTSTVRIRIIPDNLWSSINSALQQKANNPYDEGASRSLDVRQVMTDVFQDLRVVMALQARAYAVNPDNYLTSTQSLREYIYYHIGGDLRSLVTELFDQYMVGDPATWETYIQPALFDHEGSWHFPQSQWLAKSSAGFFTYSADVAQLAGQMMDRLLRRPDIAKIIEESRQPGFRPMEGQLSYVQIGTLLTGIVQRYPEAYKLMPWALRELKRGVEAREFNIQHVVDIVGQAGRTLNELRQENRLPRGFDVNQLSLAQLQDWLYAQTAQAEDSQWENAEHVYTFTDKWTIDRVTTENDLALEGQLMGHCVGGYYHSVAGGRSLIYSLRDPRGEPHATIEIEGNGSGDALQAGGPWNITQIQGKQNQMPIEEYVARIREWFGQLQKQGVKLQFGTEESYEFSIDSPEDVVRFAAQYDDNGLNVPPDEINDAQGWNRSYDPYEWGIHEADPPQYEVTCPHADNLGADAVEELLQQNRGYYHEQSFSEPDVDDFILGLGFLEDCGFYSRTEGTTKPHPQRVFELADEEFMENYSDFEEHNWEYTDNGIFEEWKADIWPQIEEQGHEDNPHDAFQQWREDDENAYYALQEKASTNLWELYLYEPGPKAAHELVEKLKLWAEKPSEQQLRLTVRHAFLRDGLLYGSNWIANAGRVVR